MSDETKLPPIRLEGAADAPILVFDDVAACRVLPGTGRVTLSAYIQDFDDAGSLIARQKTVVHLSGNALAFAALRRAIDTMELLAKPTPETEGQKPN